MIKKLTTEQFITKAKVIHGNMYDYSETEYTDSKTHVFVKCNNCGKVLRQFPHSHLQGHGCSHCKRYKNPQHGNRKSVCGVGFFDAPYSRTKDSLTKKAYRDWSNMLQRCYGNSDFPSKQAYKCCSVCREWHSFLKFREWFDDNYIEGYQLDKDILVKGNKVYSPETCCYVPPFINTLLLNCRSARGENAIGVQKRRSGYVTNIYEYGKTKYIGFFKNELDAFGAYKKEKERYIKEVSKKYFEEGLIIEKVYNALNNYNIEITD